MAKVQAKKAAASTRKGVSPKAAARRKQTSKPASKRTAKPSPKKAAAKPVARPVRKALPAKKAPASKKAAPARVKAQAKRPVTAKKPSAKTPARKTAAKTVRKAPPAKTAKPVKAKQAKPAKAAKAAKSVKAKPVKAIPAKAAKAVVPAKSKGVAQAPAGAARSSVKTVVKAAVKATAKTVAKAASVAATTVVRAVKPAADDKKKRRPRTRITSSGPATAAWFSQGEKPRPSSFIPAPPRAEAPSLVAAPPASSDRLVDANELTEFAVRTVPVRVDIEAGGGKIYLGINPTEVVLHPGEGIEWDFRYLGGADIVVEELIVEFEKPAPFSGGVFRSRRPGAARPHRQLSGPVHKSALGKRIQYTIRAFNGFKKEMATVKPAVIVRLNALPSEDPRSFDR